MEDVVRASSSSSFFYHPFRSLRDLWSKKLKIYRQYFKTFFTDFYELHWDFLYYELQNPPNLPCGSRLLLIGETSYKLIKCTIERELDITLPEISPFCQGGAVLVRKVFTKEEEIKAYLDEIYAENGRLHMKVLVDKANEQLNIVVDNFKRGDPVIAIDFETWEHNSRYLLEIGIAWWTPTSSSSRTTPTAARHLIIEDNLDKKNGAFCPNNRDNFAYGESTILPLSLAVEELTQILASYPLWVFHGSSGDLSTLRRLNVPISPSTQVIDTQVLGYLLEVKSAHSSPILLGLGAVYKLLTNSDETPSMHNAGNDAWCTLTVLLKLVERFGR